MGELTSKFFFLCKRAVKADIIKVFSFTALATLVKMLTGLVSVKVVALIIGPSGVALVGQLNNFASIAMSLASGGINTGITKYVAEYKGDSDTIKSFLSTALRITVIFSLATGLLMILFHPFLSSYIMLSPDYGYVFIIFGFTILLYALNMMLISIVNGFKEFRKYVKINIVGSVIGLVFTLLLVLTLRLKGALVSAVTYQSVMFFVTLWMIRKLPWVSWNFFRERFSKIITKKYFNYTLMAMATASTLPVSQMLLRGYVITQISLVEAGWWEAMNRLSNMYLMIITTSFSVYYFPRVSELTGKRELRHEIGKAYKVIVPILLIGFTLIYLLRMVIIQVLFTPEFYPMEKLFVWQLLGDFFKICSWILSILLVAKSMTKAFVATEIIFAFTFVGLGFLFMQSDGVVGITQGYLVNYILYNLCMIYLLRDVLFK